MNKNTLGLPRTEYPRCGSFVILLFNLYIISWWLEVGKRVEILGQIRFEFLLAALLGVVALVQQNKVSVVSPAKSKIVTGICFYLCTLFFSLLFSQDVPLSWNILINRILKLSVVALFLNIFVCSPREVWYFLLSTFISFFKVGQEAFYGKLTGSMVWQNQGIMRLHGSPGTMFGHPNSLVGKTLTLVPYLWSLFHLLKKRWKLIVLIQLIFSVNIVVFTGSRTGYVASCLLLLAFWWNSKKKVRMSLGVIILTIILSVAFPQQYKARFFSSFQGQEAEGNSKGARIGLLKDSINVFLEHPLGVGIGCFVVMQERAGRNEQGTHNLYTQILSEIGVQGFVAFGYFINTVIKALFFVRRKINIIILNLSQVRERQIGNTEEWCRAVDTEMNDLKMVQAVCTGTLLMLFMRLILGVFGHDLYEIYWWVAAGLALVMTNLLSVAEQRALEFTGSTD